MISTYDFSDVEKKSIFDVLNSVKINPYREYSSFKREVNILIVESKVPAKFLEVCAKIKDERRLLGINAQLL